MSAITFAESRAGIKGAVLVYLDRRRVGIIVPVKAGGFQYHPMGSKRHGEIFQTLDECKRSLK